MLKRYHFGLLVLLGLVLAVVPVQANKKVQFTLASGIMWDHINQLFLFPLGLSVDIYLTKNLTITPEFYMAHRDIGFRVSRYQVSWYEEYHRLTYFLQPGLMLNYHRPVFFVGAGMVKLHRARKYYLSEDVYWLNFWHLKLNAGFKISHIRIAVSFLFDWKEGFAYFPTNAANIYCAMIGYTF